MEKHQCAILLAMTILIAIATIGFMFTFVKGTTLSLEPKPPPPLFMNGTATNLTADDKDRDISIDPTADLPANGTQTISTLTGATDVDINDFPPIGVTVLIQNGSVTVTNHTVDILDEFEAEAVTSNDDGGDSSDSEEE